MGPLERREPVLHYRGIVRKHLLMVDRSGSCLSCQGKIPGGGHTVQRQATAAVVRAGTKTPSQNLDLVVPVVQQLLFFLELMDAFRSFQVSLHLEP